MKRWLTILHVAFLIGVLFPVAAFAQISNEEIEGYLSPIGWSADELENYLQDYFEMSIHDFESLEELKDWVGTPITQENRQELLNQYGMELEDLRVILAEFGESPEDYFFVEDLEAAIHFYTTYEEELNDVIGFFELLGITDEELETLFLHLSKLDEETVEAHLTALEDRIFALEDFSDASDLTQAQKEEIATLFTDMLAAFKLTAKMYIESNGQRESVTLAYLLDLEQLNGRTLIIEFYDDEGNLLLDMSINEDLFDSDFFEDVGQLLPALPHLAHEHPLGEKMPETASPYVENILIGLLLSLIAATLFVRFRKGLKSAS